MSSLNDVVTNTNSIIQENLVKLYQKLSKLKADIVDDEDDEYENFYNRINFYFSTIITELKLNFIESVKEYQRREVEYKKEIQKLSDQMKINGRDIIRLILENMTLKIENDSYEEKNLLNISHYVDVSQPLSNQSLNSKEANSLIVHKSNSKLKTNKKKSRNIPSEEISFKTELKNNINIKIQEKLLPNHSKDSIKKKNPLCIISSQANNSLGKKKNKKISNLSTFLSNANVINNTLSTNIQYKSVNNGNIQQKNRSELIINTCENLRPRRQRENLTVEKSMCNLPCYSLTKIHGQDTYTKSSLNDLRIKGNKINITSSNTQLRAKSGSNIKKGFHPNNSNSSQLNQNASRPNKSSLNLNNISSLNSHLPNSNIDFEKYKSTLLTKINIMPNVKKINLVSKLKKGNG